ncbi:unnamed protein product [Meloidogyne enterolobii]|uniref:Uncharacterized protein n=1 Tax=Meloidogyne enterolobii TaxID=390850 RepID=A0ACB1A4V5_MELEN
MYLKLIFWILFLLIFVNISIERNCKCPKNVGKSLYKRRYKRGNCCTRGGHGGTLSSGSGSVRRSGNMSEGYVSERTERRSHGEGSQGGFGEIFQEGREGYGGHSEGSGHGRTRSSGSRSEGYDSETIERRSHGEGTQVGFGEIFHGERGGYERQSEGSGHGGTRSYESRSEGYESEGTGRQSHDRGTGQEIVQESGGYYGHVHGEQSHWGQGYGEPSHEGTSNVSGFGVDFGGGYLGESSEVIHGEDKKKILYICDNYFYSNVQFHV